MYLPRSIYLFTAQKLFITKLDKFRQAIIRHNSHFVDILIASFSSGGLVDLESYTLQISRSSSSSSRSRSRSNSSSNSFIPCRIQKYNTVCVTNITNNRVTIDTVMRFYFWPPKKPWAYQAGRHSRNMCLTFCCSFNWKLITIHQLQVKFCMEQLPGS